jgi:hypothetical protein
VSPESFTVGGATVNLVTNHTATPEIEVLYAGTSPPTALFSHLGALGVTGLVPTPPPATAIDWETPDPASGRAFSVRPFAGRAHGRLEVGGAEREVALVATRYLLVRLARASSPVDGHDAGSSRPSQEPVAAGSVSARRDGLEAFTREPATPTVVASPSSPAVVVLEVLLDEAAAPRARHALGGLARVTDEQLVTWTTEQTYRGASMTATHRACRLLVEAAPGDVDAVRAALAPYRPRHIGVPAPT